MKNKKKLFWLILPFTLIMFALLFLRYPIMPTNGTYKVFHSPKKHVENVTTLIHQKKDTIDVEWEDVEVTPLYNYKDNFNYLLVDLYPQGFTILKVIRTSPFSVKASQYAMPSVYGRHYYYSDEDTSPQYTSIYAERDVKNEKLYLLQVKNSHGHGHIPAIKGDNCYINLLTLEEIPLNYYEIDEPYAMYECTSQLNVDTLIT